jgi:prephenate dehydrogenase
MRKELTIGIIGGEGRMGSYFANIFKKANYPVVVSDLHTKLTNKELAERADVVIVSVPIDVTEKIIAEICPFMNSNQLLMDLTSIKEIPIKAMLKTKACVIGLHPMFSEQNLLPGQTIIACPVRPGKWMSWVKNIFVSQGAKLRIMEPKKHDKIMAVVQSLVHFSDIAFGHTLTKLKIPVEDYLKFSSPASELKIAFCARILAQDPNLYGNIQLLNPHSKTVLKNYTKSIEQLQKINEDKDLKIYTNYFNKAGNSFGSYKNEAYNNTNYLIHAILEKRKRTADLKKRKITNQKESLKKYSLAALGPPMTYSAIAAFAHDPKSNICYLETIHEVFHAVEKGYVKQGIVPLENLLHGSVRETFDELYVKKVHIVKKIQIPIKHALVALDGVKIADIDTIISHGQALSQCKKFLDKKLSSAKKIQETSTMAAYKKIKTEDDRHSAAIVPQQTAESLNLNIIAKNIADNKENKTTFIIIERGPHSDAEPKNSESQTETMIGFEFSNDKPGQLLETFKLFAEKKINLSRIESRPSKQKIQNYIFFLDFLGHPKSKNVATVLKAVSKMTSNFKILGTNKILTS